MPVTVTSYGACSPILPYSIWLLNGRQHHKNQSVSEPQFVLVQAQFHVIVFDEGKITIAICGVAGRGRIAGAAPGQSDRRSR